MVYIDALPYLKTSYKKVYLPREGNMYKQGMTTPNIKPGYGNLVFLLTDDVNKSINMINNQTNCLGGNYYKRFYYNFLYRGVIGTKRYNIRDMNERKEVYDKIKNKTNLTSHPLVMLDKTPNRNTYYDMSKYIQIYENLSKKYTPIFRLTLFWNYFKSIINAEQCSQFNRKIILIDVDLYDKFGTNLQENITNPIFLIYYTLYKKLDLMTDLDVDFLFYCNNAVLKVNPSKCGQRDHVIFKTEINKVFNRKTNFEEVADEKRVDEDEQKETLKAQLKVKYNLTGSSNTDEEVITKLDTKPIKTKTEPESKTDYKSKETLDKEEVIITNVNKSQKPTTVEDELDKKIDSKIDEAKKQLEEAGVSTTSREATNFIKTQTEMEIEDDKALIENIYKVVQSQKVPTTPLSSARDKKLRERQASLNVKNVSFANVAEINSSKRPVPVKNVSNSLKTLNENVKEVKYTNINKDYIENVMPKDLAKVFTSLNNKAMKLYVRDVKVEDTSNELNYKETWRVTLEDELNNRHSITVDIPKFLDNKFLYLGGNKKIISKQSFLYPVAKIAPDTVQIVTNYNKIFIRRLGTKSISSVERMLKLISNNDTCKEYFTSGNAFISNKAFVTTVEYDEFSKVFLKFKTADCEIFFNQQEATKDASEKKLNIPENHIYIGTQKKDPIYLNIDTGDIQAKESKVTVCDLILSHLPNNIQSNFNSIRSTKKLMYTTATIMTKPIPFITLLLFWEGISSVFKKMNLEFSFHTKYPSEIKPNENVLRFKNCYLLYKEDLATSLLMNGLRIMNPENYNFEDFNTNDAYTDFFKKVYGKLNIMNAINNYYEFIIDPITEEILKDINLPTDLIELGIYANALLADQSYTRENSQTLSRVRSTEIIPAILYYELSNEYLNYKNSMGKKKISLPRDCVIKQLLALQTVEDYSTLNPVVELDKDRVITAKGYRGINLERSYTEEKRSYDSSMVGIDAMSTTLGANCGVNRYLTLEPTITSIRGYVDIKENRKEELKDVNLYSPSELLYPLGNTRDDSIRTSINLEAVEVKPL